METTSKQIQVGQRIYYKGDMANASGSGVVVNIRRNASPSIPGVQIRSYAMDLKRGALVPFDSSVSYDVLLEDGRQFNAVYSSNIGGTAADKSCRFMLVEGEADGEEIAGLQANAALRDARLKAKATEVAAIFAKAQEAARATGVKLGLTPVAEFKGRGSAAASNLRKELKAAGVKASTTQDGYTCIRVRLDAGATPEQITNAKTISAKYKAGSFDGMADMYEYDPSTWGSVFGDVRYVFVTRDNGVMV